MIHVDEALRVVLENVFPLDTISLPLGDALGYTVSRDVRAPIPMPPFDNSAMDGYALLEWDKNDYTVIGEIQAGDDASDYFLNPGEAVRIFTGAMVPKSATTVVKQEITERSGNTLYVLEAFGRGDNIRKHGEQIEQDAIALESGTTLNAAAIGFLGMLGVETVTVHRKPKIKLLITGNELAPIGTPLKQGQIYESNSITLLSGLRQVGCDAEIVQVEDDYDATKKFVGQLLDDCDLLISSGGISVGDYDFVGKAMVENGVESLFYKVKQKPGKPLFFGHTPHSRVFALPGNPASALSCFYLYVLPAIHKLMGAADVGLEKRTVTLRDTYTKRIGLTHFLKGFVSGNDVRLLEFQSSSMLNSFTAANCLIRIDENQSELNPGEEVMVYMLP
jgi:molybdopterin molybdotransferase